MSNATSFGRQATTYAKGRPGYPSALYDWIVAHSPDTKTVWDVGTGSGQAAIALTEHFETVHATDISDAQIAAAPRNPRIKYSVTAAQSSGLADHSADTVTVATAVHWFADAAFWAEVARVGKPGALFCAWTYQLPTCPPPIMMDFLTPLYEILDPYWAEGNRICMAGYNTGNLNCALPVLDTPDLDAGANWTAEQLADFALSWSAHLRAREDRHAEELSQLRQDFLVKYAEQTIPVSMPLSLFAARIN